MPLNFSPRLQSPPPEILDAPFKLNTENHIQNYLTLRKRHCFQSDLHRDAKAHICGFSQGPSTN